MDDIGCALYGSGPAIEERDASGRLESLGPTEGLLSAAGVVEAGRPRPFTTGRKTVLPFSMFSAEHCVRSRYRQLLTDT